MRVVLGHGLREVPRNRKRMVAAVLTDSLNLRCRNGPAERLFDLQSDARIKAVERANARQRAIAEWVKHFKNVDQSQNRVRAK
jgi:hypothetical protein